MAGPSRNLIVEQGADWTYAFRWLRNGEPMDVSDWTATMQVREEPSSATVLLELSDANGRITRGDPGVLNLLLTGTQTAAIAFARYRAPVTIGGRLVTLLGAYDLRVVSAEDYAVRLVAGLLYVSPGVTR